tara:strand:- start:418 stop:1053 length:636 start_codon:yes stop_codon:yes gene_type:complete
MEGKLISFEGIDGSGKSTQIRMLEDKFGELGINYITYREPGGTELSEKIREILLDKKNIELTYNSESLLFAAARAQLTSKKIKPSLNDGVFVICDRFIDSTIAYQGYGRGLSIEHLNIINNIATEGLKPDVTFILDLDPNIAMKRIKHMETDRMESLGSTFFNSIRNGYDKILHDNSERCVKINADQSVDSIFTDIKKEIINRFNEEIKCF